MSTPFRSTVLLIAALAAAADVPRATPFTPPPPGAVPDGQTSTLGTPGAGNPGRPQNPPTTQSPPQGTGPSSSADSTRPEDSDDADDATPPAAPPAGATGTLAGSSRVEIIRMVDGEFAKTLRALPGKTDGFTLHVGKPINEGKMSDALRLQGTAIPAGEPVQITQMDFESRRIVIQVNGGAKKKFHLMDHLSIGGSDPQVVDRHEGLGAVIVVDFGRPVPDLTPAQVKMALAPLLDFSREHSATVNWVETLPPEFQDAIRDHKALPGMDQDTVIAAIGRPDKKVRERNQQGVETEDWIYGNPPARTIFVTFLGDKVQRVKEFN
jgi:hypothetical protein